MNFIKNFLEWFNLKKELDLKNHKPPFVSEGQIWWINLGENIGTEISGKGVKFARPAFIYKKISKFTFLVIPTSTKNKIGSWFVDIICNEKKMICCLNQIKVVDYRRFMNKIGDLDSESISKIKESFLNFYK
jgi:mRNA interferase MazF